MNDFQHVRFESLIFDFDGTLAELCLDFSDMKRRLSVLAERYLNAVPSPAAVPALEWLKELTATLRQRNPSGAERFRNEAETLVMDMELEAARRGCLFPFTRSLLQELLERKLRIAIITRNCEEAVRIVFPDLDRYCNSFLAREHVPRVKPDPDHLLRALRALSASPDKALMVGDHPIDVQTGQRAGVLSAGVFSGRASRSDLIESGARWTARNCEELVRELVASGWIG